VTSTSGSIIRLAEKLEALRQAVAIWRILFAPRHPNAAGDCSASLLTHRSWIAAHHDFHATIRRIRTESSASAVVRSRLFS
jgi:hypothetical protein